MEKIRCVIVEDEIPSAEELKYIFSKYEFIIIEGIANDGKCAMEIIENKKPDVVLMDINIPIENGMSLAKKIKAVNENINVIFITAYEKYAVEAFELEALDYILKPFDENRIDLTVKRLINKWNNRESEENTIPKIINEIINKIDREEKGLKKIPCEKNGKIILVDIKDTYFFYIEDEKTYVKTKNDSYLVGHTLHELEKKTKFFRAHRSYLVNMDNIKELYSWFNGTYKLVMNDVQNSEVPISRNNVKKLKEYLGI